MENGGQEKLRWMAEICHELNTPLSGILGFLDLVEAQNTSPAERQEYLERMRASCRSLQELIRCTLELAKLESGELRLHRLPIPLRERVLDAVEGLQGYARRKGLRLQTEWREGAPAEIETDPLRLWQVMNNVVGNAIKFTDQGEIAVEVFALSNGVAIDVKDTGVGIGTDERTALFHPFAQGQAASRFGSAGLGLALSRGLCRAMGGDLLLLESAQGSGSLFRIQLPYTFP